MPAAHGWRHVLVEVNNETNVRYDHAILKPDRVHELIARVKATRDASVADFSGRRGWFTYPSQANFIFTEPKNRRGEAGPAVARSAYDFLCARKVLVRLFPSHALTASFLRISVGTPEQNDRLLASLS